MSRNQYDTKQKELILNIIKNEGKEFTIKDIYKRLNNEVGLTTIYRFIDKLEHDNLLSKTISSDNVTYYQYLEKCTEDNHFYLKCNNCKKMIHIDCDCIEDLSDHIKNKHSFKLSKENIVIKGICNNCLKGEK